MRVKNIADRNKCFLREKSSSKSDENPFLKFTESTDYFPCELSFSSIIFRKFKGVITEIDEFL